MPKALSESFDSLRTSGSLSVHADSSADSELKAVEEACREASRTVEAFLAYSASF
jgi:hypothetical protein